MTKSLMPESPTTETSPPAPVLRDVDYVEWWVGNARAFSYFLRKVYGFELQAYAGPETGRRDRVSYVLTQGDIRFVVSGALSPDSPIAEHVRSHGDGVHDVCFRVDDAAAAYDMARRRGALEEHPPQTEDDEHGAIHHAVIGTYGETVHTLLDRSSYDGVFAPGFVAVPDAGEPASSGSAGEEAVGPGGNGNGAEEPVGLTHIDHVVGNVERGSMDDWVAYYETVLGFDQLLHFSQDQISTEYSALASTVVWNGDRVVLPINEPADGRRKSQIEEYLDYYRSPGVQHMALHTSDIVTAVRSMRRRGARFITVPPEYYVEARARMEGVDLDWGALADLGILVDRDKDGYLLQTFTEPLCDRPTVFFEIIQREGCRGFGEGNFKALFEAIERAQAERGNL